MAQDEWRKRLREAVESSGKSLRSISLAAGCSPGYLHGILSSDKEPTIARLVKLCGVLGVSVTWVVLGIAWSPVQERLLLLMSDLPDEQKALLLDLAKSLAREKG
jgi:transcriptional regulator with XRE-family HTH domain